MDAEEQHRMDVYYITLLRESLWLPAIEEAEQTP